MRIGDRLRIKPTFDCEGGMGDRKPAPTDCTVIFVNEAHALYVVEFDGLRFRETFYLGNKRGTYYGDRNQL